MRLGMEDNVYISKGEFAKSNAELVKKGIRMAGDLGVAAATPSEARKILGLRAAA